MEEKIATLSVAHATALQSVHNMRDGMEAEFRKLQLEADASATVSALRSPAYAWSAACVDGKSRRSLPHIIRGLLV